MRFRPLLPCLCLLLAPVRAQDDDLPPDEVADLVELYVERGIESLRQGSYDEARLRFAKALRRDPGNAAARIGVTRTHRAVGDYERAEAELVQLFEAHPGHRTGKVLRAEMELLRGRAEVAAETLREVIASGGDGPDLDGLRARVLLAEAKAARGQRDAARTVLDDVTRHYKKRRDDLARARFDADQIKQDYAVARPISQEMTLVARALRLYVDLSPLDHDFLQAALELVNGARELDEDNWEAWIEYVRITRAERLSAIARARKAKRVVEQRNPELAELYVEVAKSVLVGFGSGEARQLAETALRINPALPSARAIVARIALEDNEYARAGEHIEKGLAVDPRQRDLLALEATFQLLHGREKEFTAGMKKVLAVDPTYGEGYHLAGLVIAARQRRFDRAAELVREGLRIDPLNFQAHATVGIFLANLGRAKEALTALQKSKELFPFDHPVRENFRDVLQYVTGTMTEYRTEHFVVRFDPAEFAVHSQFLPQLLEECWDDMVERYDFTPKTPVLVECFAKADDFSVRTLGIPGIPALGACFGGLITLDSPQALPPGQFLWASTARHEFAHVMSLQLSGGQVPRWFTEGLSVLEEKPLDTGWGREERFERQVFDAFQTDTLPEIATFDAMFRTPRVAYAYYVGGLMLQFLQERSGEKGIVQALRLYGKDTPMREVFQESFGLKLEEFDREFRDYIGKRVGKYRLTPNYALIRDRLRARVLRDGTDGDALLKLAWAFFQTDKLVDAGAYLDRALEQGQAGKPLTLLLRANLALKARRLPEARRHLEAFFTGGGEDFDARMLMARFHKQENEDVAFVAALKQAKANWPLRVLGASPHAALRQHYLANGRPADALRELEEQASVASKDVNLRLALARAYLGNSRPQDAVRILEDAYRITTFDRRVHSTLLPLYRDAGAREKALRTARCVVALRNDKDSPEETTGFWLDLAEAAFDAGKKDEAKSALKQAIEAAGGEEEPRIRRVKERIEDGQ